MFLRRVRLAALAAFWLSCSSSAQPSADAGRDAPADPSRDARVDSGRDARVDRARDGARDSGADSGRDAGVDPGLDADWLGCDPGWRPMPGLAPDLTIYYATNPSCLLLIAWESCGTGCQRLVDDPRFQRSITPGMGWSDGDRHLFTVVGGPAHVLHANQPAMTVVATAEGEVFGGWRGTTFGDDTRLVRIGATGGGDGWMGFEMPAHRATPDGNFASYDERLYHAPLELLTTPLEPVLQLAPPIVSVTDAAQFVAASDTTLAAEVEPRGEVLVVEHESRHWLGGRGSATPATPQEVFVVGHDVYWMDFFEGPPGVRLAHGTWSTESEVFYALPGVDLLGFSSDDHDFAWVQAYGRSDAGYSRMELWTAPYTNDKSALRPRMVTANYDGSNTGTLQDGVYSTMGPDRKMQVYMLADGTKREWQLPPGWALRGPELWVSTDEVAYSARTGTTGQSTVMRLSIADAFTPVP